MSLDDLLSSRRIFGDHCLCELFPELAGHKGLGLDSLFQLRLDILEREGSRDGETDSIEGLGYQTVEAGMGVYLSHGVR